MKHISQIPLAALRAHEGDRKPEPNVKLGGYRMPTADLATIACSNDWIRSFVPFELLHDAVDRLAVGCPHRTPQRVGRHILRESRERNGLLGPALPDDIVVLQGEAERVKAGVATRTYGRAATLFQPLSDRQVLALHRAQVTGHCHWQILGSNDNISTSTAETQPAGIDPQILADLNAVMNE